MSQTPPPSQGPSYFSDAPYEAPHSGDLPPPGRGMVNHVRLVAILNAVQGGLELCISIICILTGTMAMAMRDVFVQQAIRQGDPNPEAMPTMMAAVYLGMGIPLLLVGILRLAASGRMYFFRNRVLGIVSLCLGLISTFTGCCSITAIGVAVYGLIVLFNKEVGEAFQLRDQGAPADEVLKTFNSRAA